MAKNRHIQALMDSGADAFSNMYELYITPPGNDAGTIMTVRAQSFKIPEAAVEVYDKKYHGNSLKAVKPSITFERKFSVTFRADAGYNLPDMFLQWHGLVGNPVSGGVANTSAHAEGIVRVKSLVNAYIAAKNESRGVNEKWFNGPSGEIAATNSDTRDWTFENVWVEKVSQFEYKTDTADPLTFTVDFNFGHTDYPAYNNI